MSKETDQMLDELMASMKDDTMILHRDGKDYTGICYTDDSSVDKINYEFSGELFDEAMKIDLRKAAPSIEDLLKGNGLADILSGGKGGSSGVIIPIEIPTKEVPKGSSFIVVRAGKRIFNPIKNCNDLKYIQTLYVFPRDWLLKDDTGNVFVVDEGCIELYSTPVKKYHRPDTDTPQIEEEK